MIKQLYRFLNPRFQNLFLEYRIDFRPRYGHGHPPHPELYEIIERYRDSYERFLLKALSYKDDIWKIRAAGNEADPVQPVWNNGYLPGLDIIGIYTMLAELSPAKYVEIGSGHSTKVAYKAKQEQGLDTEIVSIDPQPRADMDHLADQIIRERLETIDFASVAQLEAGDVLFLDNTHRMLPNSDVTVFFLEILPRLKPGVVVHLHDIYLPYDYPQFMCDRFYSEQYGLAMFLLANPEKYETLLPNYFVSEDDELAGMLAPIWEHEELQSVERHGGSFWFRVK